VHIDRALKAFTRLSAGPWVERAEAELRATGARVRRTRKLDTGQLTAQELQVARVVAHGATNKEAGAQLYLSPKTIEKHLGAAYAKLGLRSRTELARVFAVDEHPSTSIEAQLPPQPLQGSKVDDSQIEADRAVSK
jgi:DNA-binding NarL/FixJ family response regulator